MSKPLVQFNKRVIYKGVMHHQGTPFEVDADDLEHILDRGGFEVVKPLDEKVNGKVTEEPKEPEEPENENAEEDAIITEGGLNLNEYDWETLADASYEDMKDISKALGIDLPGNAKKAEFFEAIKEQLVYE